jgi:hypothetical protein
MFFNNFYQFWSQMSCYDGPYSNYIGSLGWGASRRMWWDSWAPLLTPRIHLSIEYGLGIQFFADKSREKQPLWLDSKNCMCGLSNLIILSLKVVEIGSICY